MWNLAPKLKNFNIKIKSLRESYRLVALQQNIASAKMRCYMNSNLVSSLGKGGKGLRERTRSGKWEKSRGPKSIDLVLGVGGSER